MADSKAGISMGTSETLGALTGTAQVPIPTVRERP